MLYFAYKVREQMASSFGLCIGNEMVRGSSSTVPLVDRVHCSWGGAGAGAPAQDVVEVNRVHRQVDRGREGTQHCVNNRVTCD